PRRLPTRPRLQKEARSSAGGAGATNGREIEQIFRTEITVFLLELLFAFRFDRGWCSGAGAAPGEQTLSGFFSSAALGGAGSSHLHASRPRRAARLDAIGPFNQRALGRRSGCDIWHAPDYLDRTNGQEPAAPCRYRRMGFRIGALARGGFVGPFSQRAGA